MSIAKLAIASLIVWGVAAFCLMPSFVRCWRGAAHRRPVDTWRTIVAYAAAVFVLFNARRVLIPDDEQVILALYAISIALGVYVLILLRQERA